MKNWIKNRGIGKTKVHPKDRWIWMCKKQEVRSGKFQVACLLGIIICSLTDFANIGDILTLSMDLSLESGSALLNAWNFFLPRLLAMGISILMAIMVIAGSSTLRLANNGLITKKDIAISVTSIILVLIGAAVITWARLSSEVLKSQDQVDLLYNPISLGFMYTCVMYFGIFLSFVYGLIGFDTLKGKFTKECLSRIEYETKKYNKDVASKQKEILEKEYSYSENLSNAKKEILDSFEELENIMNKLKVIQDPAQIAEIQEKFKISLGEAAS